MPGAMDARFWSRPAPIGCLIGWPTSTCMRQGCSIMPPDNEKSRLDDAARAGWLYFIAGHTQDEIAKLLKVSRADRATPGFAVPLRTADHLPARTSDRRLHGPGAAAHRSIRPHAPARSCRPIRPRNRRRRHRRARREPARELRCAATSQPSSRSARAGRCAPRSTRFRRWIARTISSSRWSVTSRPMAPPPSSTPSRASPT